MNNIKNLILYALILGINLIGIQNINGQCSPPTISGMGTCSDGTNAALDGEYYIELNVIDLAGFSSVLISDGTSTLTATATGSIFFGPYINGGNHGTTTFTARETGGDPLCFTTIEVAEIYCLEDYGGAALACDCEAAIPGFILSQIMPGAFDAATSDMIYVLIDENGLISSINSTGYFTGLVDANYSISAINVDEANTTALFNSLIIGSNYAGIDLSSLCVDVCPIPTSFTVLCPLPSCNATANTPCVGEDLNLLAGATNGDTYSWTGPNNFTSDEQNPSILATTVAAAGTYIVEVTNTTSDCVSICNVEVVVNENPILTPQIIEICADVTSVNLTLLETEIGENGGVWSNPSPLTADPADSPFTYTYTNGSGCSSSTTVTYTILDLPTVSPTVNLPICNGIDIELSANPTSIGTFIYSWTGPNGFISTDENPVITAQDIEYPGVGTFTYFVTITYTGITPCSSVAIPVEVTIDENPTIVCRQPISTKSLPDQCGVPLVVLPPYITDESTGVSSITSDAPDFFGIGETIVTWSVEDICGQIQTCETSVFVADLEFPQINSCNTAIAWTYENCEAIVTVSSSATDNCGEPIMTGTGTYVFPLGAHELLVTATDAAGNVTEHPFTVFVHDNVLPTLETCPEDITISSEYAATGNVLLPEPYFSDNCEIIGMENDAPSIFTEPTTPVIWTATDSYGLTNTCIYNVNISDELIVIEGLQGLESSVENAAARSTVRWNAPMLNAQCQECLETDFDDYEYLGEYYGHQYFKYTGAPVTWEIANELAETTFNGHLASINTFAENTFLFQNANISTENLWIGMSVTSNETNDFDYVWTNNADSEFSNFGDAINILNTPSAVILKEGGAWSVVEGTEQHGFVVERPCMEITQTGPMAEVENEEGEMELKLLAMGDEWAVGDYLATYLALDQCGNQYVGSFPVKVDEPQANYCPTGGADVTTFVRQVNIGGNRNNSAAIGYEDYTDEVRDVELTDEESFDNHVFLELVSGGNPYDTEIFWRVWIDLNNDGDFYDANELVVEKFDIKSATKAYLPLELFTNEERRMRVALSRYDYPEACLDFWAGEAEDYLVSYTGIEGLGINIESIYNGGNGLINNVLDENNVNIQPNPTQGNIEIELPDLETNSIIKIFTISGQIILETEMEAFSRSKNIDVKSLHEGLYLMEISNDENKVQKKMVIKR